MGLVPLRRSQRAPLPLSTLGGHSEKSAVCNQEKGPHQNLTELEL